MGIPDPVYILKQRAEHLYRRVTRWVILLEHFEGEKEVVLAQPGGTLVAYSTIEGICETAQRFLDTGCYKSVEIVPVRTSVGIPTDEAYIQAQRATALINERSQAKVA